MDGGGNQSQNEKDYSKRELNEEHSYNQGGPGREPSGNQYFLKSEFFHDHHQPKQTLSDLNNFSNNNLDQQSKNYYMFNGVSKLQNIEKTFLTVKSLSFNNQNVEGILYDDYVVIKECGRGHFGTVYKVKNKIDEQIYAVKHVKRGGRTEARAMAAITSLYQSKYIVRYFQSWMEGKDTYIVMEYCPSTLKDEREVDERTLTRALKHVCKALCDLHEDYLVHLDIKPDNILLGEDGKFKLGDLGHVKMVKMKDDASTIREGDSRFMARELINEFDTDQIIEE